MGLSTRDQLRYAALGFLLLGLLLWVIGDTVFPFLLGAAIAYFLDPLADRLEEAGLSRTMATVAITLAALVVTVGVGVFLIPQIFNQLEQLALSAPDFARRVIAEAQARFPEMFEEGSAIREAIAAAGERLRDQAGSLLNSVLASGLALFDFLLLLVVAPVVAFYLLLDWDRLIAQIDGWLPREHVGEIRQIAGDIDRVLAGFVRGQLTVCVILGTFYAFALMTIGLQFGLLIGLFAGLISFIPFVGSIVGGATSLGVALFQYWNDPVWVVAVAAIFVVGQMVEGNVLTPRLVGRSVKLHPVMLMFALAAFGTLFGFTGMLIAVPLAASIGVLARYGLRRYKEGRFYQGPQAVPDDEGAEQRVTGTGDR
ncbi:MAG: AI-2E family transporter [Pseudomonadota bacterium]